MLSQLFIDILPCLIALIGGILLGMLSRPLACYISKTTVMTEEQSRGIILHSAKKVCFGMFILVALVAFTKYLFSYGTLITTAYLTFLISTMLWGFFMGLVKYFVTTKHAIKILQKL